MLRKIVILTVLGGFLVSHSTEAQDVRTDSVAVVSESVPDTVSKPVLMLDGKPMTEKQMKRYYKQMRRDSIRETKNIWWSVLGGPSYTPESSLGVGGAVLSSFRFHRNDSITKRSFIPAGFAISLNGTFVLAGAGTLFFNENKFRIYVNYSFRNEPAHYYGKGYESIENVQRGDSTTKYHRTYFQFYPRFVWEVKPNLFAGTLFELNLTKASDVNPVMAADPYYLKFKPKYVNIGVGGLLQYDTRDDVATPTSGMLVSGMAKFFGKYLGGAYNYELFELEYRQFKNVFRPRSTLAWMMAYGILEYRHMFGSPAMYKSGNFWAKCGFVAWVGTGTIGNTPFVDWNKWKLNYGAGLRIQVQPGKNFRLDLGKDPANKGISFYMNMTEAF